MKRALLSLSAVVALAACGQSESPVPSSKEPAAAPAPETPETRAAPPIAPTEDPAPAEQASTAGPLPLTTGVYVVGGENCANPSNAGIRIYDGRGLSGSQTKACRLTVNSRDGAAIQADNSCIDTYSGQRTSSAVSLRIPDATHFTIGEAGRSASYRLCPAAEVPSYLQDLVTPE